MQSSYHTLHPETPVSEAIQKFYQASLEEQKKIFGMMVTDDCSRLVGMLSMYDILLFIRPKHVSIWGEMDDIEPEGLFEYTLTRTTAVHVSDLMTTDLITISPDTHILMIVDIMLKNHVRRIPVLENETIQGIVYLSDVFYSLLQTLIQGFDTTKGMS
jgi:CBS domain-containing protein